MTEIIRLHTRAKALAEREFMGERARALGRTDAGAKLACARFEREALVKQVAAFMGHCLCCNVLGRQCGP